MKKKNKKSSDWEQYEEQESEPFITSDYEHKAFLITPKIKHLKTPKDMMRKELSLSYIDEQFALLYGNKLQCIEEWYSLGFKDIADRRFLHLLTRLSLFKSIDGFERILQSANVSASALLHRKSVSITPSSAEESGSGIDLGGLLESMREHGRKLKEKGEKWR